MNTSFLNRPFLHEHTKNHLILQIFYKHITLNWILAPSLVIYYAYELLNGVFFKGLFFKLSFLFIPFAFIKLSREYQAIILCLSLKLTFAITSIILLTVGLYASHSQERNDFYFILLFGLSIFPGPEYFKRFKSHQKIFTFIRIFTLATTLYYLYVNKLL